MSHVGSIHIQMGNTRSKERQREERKNGLNSTYGRRREDRRDLPTLIVARGLNGHRLAVIDDEEAAESMSPKV